MSFLVEPHRSDDVHFAVAGLSPNEPYTIREFDANHFKPVVIVGVRMNGVALKFVAEAA